MDITVSRIGSRAFLRIDGASAEIKDYKISSPMRGRTELEVVFEFEGGTTEFSSTASSTEHLLQLTEDTQERVDCGIYCRGGGENHVQRTKRILDRT